MDVKINKRFVRQRLLDLDIDQRQLSIQSGIPEQTISRLMNGRGFTSRTLGKLALALRCRPNDLVVGEMKYIGIQPSKETPP